MSNYILLVRGLPGSGKTSLTEIMSRPISCSADDYFVDKDGLYQFDPRLLPEAHQSCQDKARREIKHGKNVAVHNTFCQRWEMEPYIQLAKEFEYRLIVISTYDGGCSDEELAKRNTHGVPLSSIQAMRGRWEEDWQNGNPIPPWER